MRGNHRGSGIERLDGDPIRGEHLRIVVSSAPPQPERERPYSYLPLPIKLFLKLGLPIFGLLAVFVLPKYLDCRNQHASGLFYYGMTVGACTRQTAYDQIGALQRQFADLARAIGTR